MDLQNFTGNGAECVVNYLKNGSRGWIVNNGNIVVHETKIVELSHTIHTVPYWLTMPCTYNRPLPIWKECSIGEALDAVLQKQLVQVKSTSWDWTTFSIQDWIDWNWLDLDMQYRKEEIV